MLTIVSSHSVAVADLKASGIAVALSVLLPDVFSHHEADAAWTSAHGSGACLDTVRTCLRSNRIAAGNLSLVSVDADKLTQGFFGLGEAACEELRPKYAEQLVLSSDSPFAAMDRDLRSLVEMTVDSVRSTNKHMKVLSVQCSA